MAPLLRSALRCRRWSHLPSEILDLILQRLALLDCFTFAKVCASWRSVLLTRYRINRPPPCMMLRGKGKDFLSGTLVCVDGRKALELRSPRPNFRPSEQIVGSSMGWLVIASVNVSRLYLLNPTTKEKIQLPSEATGSISMKLSFDCDHTCFSVEHVDLSSAPNSGRDCVLVAGGHRACQGRIFAYCRPGDREWTTFRQSWMSDVDQTVFYKGDLYVFSFYRKLINVCSFDPRPKNTRSIACNNMIGFSHLFVVSDGELLMVVYHLIDRTVTLRVFKHERPDRWLMVKNLGDRALLIGRHGAESFCTQDLMVGSGFEANCIYYGQSSPRASSGWPGPLAKFSMTDGSNEVFPFSRDRDGYIEWIVPQTW